MENKINILSTFSGVGGLDLPFHKDKRFNIVANSEIDKHCSAVLKYHFDTPNLGDVSKINPESLGKIDLILSSFPCTDISIQGKQAGLVGNRSGLIFNLLDIVESVNPSYVLLENVKNLLSINKGADFEIINEIFEELGYKMYSRVFDSSEYGTSQQRLRVFMLAVRNDINEFGESNPLDAVKGTENGKGKTEGIISWSKSTRENHIDFRIRQDGLTNTLTTGRGCKGASTGNMVLNNNVIRELSPNECEYLQTWKQDWTKFGDYGEDGVLEISSNQRYKMCGNGVTTNVAEAIKNEIFGNQYSTTSIKF